MIYLTLFVLSILLTRLIISCNFVTKTTTEEWKEKTVPTLGGTVIFVLFVLPMYFFYPLIAIGATLLFVVGVADDLRGMEIGFRLGVQLFVSVLLVLHFNVTDFCTITFIMLVSIFLVNAFNFIDNSDGICLGIACLISIVFCPKLLVVLLPLLYYNINGKIYLGDCGSTVIGYLLCFFVLKDIYKIDGSYYGLIMIFAYPIVDTLFVIIRRILEGQKPWIGDQRHTSHLLTKIFNNQYIAINIIMFFQFVCIVYWSGILI